jgi:hypothetical protein
VTFLTAGCAQRADDSRVMSYTNWMRRQLETLEKEISRHSVFDSDRPATAAQLEELRTKVVIHTYLKQQLLRRETVVSVSDEEVDTQEFVIVRRA